MSSGITYKPARILSISSATGWSHHPLDNFSDLDPVAVFALMEIGEGSSVRQMILPLSAPQLTEFNKSGSISIDAGPHDLHARLFHSSQLDG